MEDHHVDRPGVEAEQSVQPTGTNRSKAPTHTARVQRPDPAARRPQTPLTPITRVGSPGLVAIAGGKAPDPIPNSAVKTPSADGTASQGAEE